MSFQTEEQQREMLQRVGIMSKRKRRIQRDASLEMFRNLIFHLMRTSTSVERENPLLKRIEKLEKTVEDLKSERKSRKLPSKADLIYLKFKEELEREHFGKIVAIDVESENIVGIGDSVLEAYHSAKKNISKNRFSYRRVGFPYVHRL